VEVGAPDPEKPAAVGGPVAEQDVRSIQRDPAAATGVAGDEVLVDPGAVEVGARDRAGVGFGPGDVGAVGRQPARAGGEGGGDEVLVGPGAVEVGAPDGRGSEVGPVDVRTINSQPAVRSPRAGDEALVDPGAVEVGAPDHPVIGGCCGVGDPGFPVDVR